jgi:hypothetical protein
MNITSRSADQEHTWADLMDSEIAFSFVHTHSPTLIWMQMEAPIDALADPLL